MTLARTIAVQFGTHAHGAIRVGRLRLEQCPELRCYPVEVNPGRQRLVAGAETSSRPVAAKSRDDRKRSRAWLRIAVRRLTLTEERGYDTAETTESVR